MFTVAAVWKISFEFIAIVWISGGKPRLRFSFGCTGKTGNCLKIANMGVFTGTKKKKNQSLHHLHCTNMQSKTQTCISEGDSKIQVCVPRRYNAMYPT